MTKTLEVPISLPTIRANRAEWQSLSEPTGADLSLDPYADLETGARLIGRRAGQQLRAIVTRAQRRLA